MQQSMSPCHGSIVPFPKELSRFRRKPSNLLRFRILRFLPVLLQRFSPSFQFSALFQIEYRAIVFICRSTDSAPPDAEKSSFHPSYNAEISTRYIYASLGIIIYINMLLIMYAISVSGPSNRVLPHLFEYS